MADGLGTSDTATPGCLQRRDIGPPRVFISSTFEDLLEEVRDQLKNELEAASLRPLMSDLGSFIFTDGRSSITTDTIQAAAVSDFYVLIVGRRYGTSDGDGRSVTELEYEAARSAAIPTAVYVHEKVWSGFESYRNGAVGDTDWWVDDERVFGLLERVTGDGLRCCPFTHGREITTDLRSRLGNLLGGYLRFDARAAHWLWTEEYTRQVERSAEEVWILTPNFYWDYADPDFRQLVFSNVVERGASYYYLYSATAENKARVEEMIRSYEGSELGDDWTSRVHYAGIPPEHFNWCAEQALYDPGVPGRERGIIVDAMDERDKMNKTNIELGRSKRADFRRQFTRLWLEYGEGLPGGAAELSGPEQPPVPGS